MADGWTYRIDCASHHSPKWIPSSIIEPVPHVIEAIFGQILGDSVIEVWIELMNDTLVLDDLQFNHRKDHSAGSDRQVQFPTRRQMNQIYTSAGQSAADAKEKNYKTLPPSIIKPRDDTKHPPDRPADSGPPERRPL